VSQPASQPVGPQEVIVQPVKPLAIMASAATNNAERMVHFLVSKFGSVRDARNRVGFVRIPDRGQNLRVMVRRIGGIVESAKSLRTVIPFIVRGNLKIEQNSRDRKFVSASGKL
jgi:hypothetical protein